ncbi:hypothetical protein [Pseudophaeobacter arcticus]|uniref:hypothetical protein n=1 Tax=Pseudophaeobacter arcticus TaxID=385492 RepID=UPI003A97A426
MTDLYPGDVVVIRAAEDWPEHLFRVDYVFDDCVGGYGQRHSSAMTRCKHHLSELDPERGPLLIRSCQWYSVQKLKSRCVASHGGHMLRCSNAEVIICECVEGTPRPCLGVGQFHAGVGNVSPFQSLDLALAADDHDASL